MSRLTYTIIVFVSLVFGQNSYASKVSAIKSALSACSKKVLGAPSFSTHVLDHWLAIAGKANHSIFKITKDQAKKIVVDTTKKQAAWTFKKSDEEIARLMNKGVNNIKLAGGKGGNQTYLSYNHEKGVYDLVVEQWIKGAGTRGENIVKMVINTKTGDLITMYPIRRSTNLATYKHVGAAFFVATPVQMNQLLEDYEEDLQSKCNCELKEPSEFSYVGFLAEILLPIGYGSKEANSGEAEFIQWQNFLYFCI